MIITLHLFTLKQKEFFLPYHQKQVFIFLGLYTTYYLLLHNYPLFNVLISKKNIKKKIIIIKKTYCPKGKKLTAQLGTLQITTYAH
jgi:hypothetical protein